MIQFYLQHLGQLANATVAIIERNQPQNFRFLSLKFYRLFCCYNSSLEVISVNIQIRMQAQRLMLFQL